MKTFEDIQLAIAVLPVREWLEIKRWVMRLATRQINGVREPSPVYGPTPALAALQTAVLKLDAYQLAELREWIEPLADEAV
jgi:hypothetical protein